MWIRIRIRVNLEERDADQSDESAEVETVGVMGTKRMPRGLQRRAVGK